MNKIVLSNDCWGDTSYFGMKNGRQYTEAYDCIEELREDNIEFLDIETIELKNKSDIKIILTGDLNKITSSIIDELHEREEEIYWNDSTSKHFIIDFKINDIWFESTIINNELQNITFNVFQ